MHGQTNLLLGKNSVPITLQIQVSSLVKAMTFPSATVTSGSMPTIKDERLLEEVDIKLAVEELASRQNALLYLQYRERLQKRKGPLRLASQIIAPSPVPRFIRCEFL